MRRLMLVCIVAMTAMPGCTVRYTAEARSSGSGSATTSQVSVSSGSPLGNAIIIGVMLTDGLRRPDRSRAGSHARNQRPGLYPAG